MLPVFVVKGDISMANDTKNFRVSEFACKHCGENKIAQDVIDMAQIIRDELGLPVKVNSGYRCDAHNKNVGGVKGSRHTKGHAADFSCSLGAKAMFRAIQKLHKDGKLPMLGYCICYPSFCHVDIDKRASGNLWEIRK